MMIALIEAGMKVDGTDDVEDKTALIHASLKGQLGAVQTLLEHGAAVDYTKESSDWTALMCAAG